MLPATVLLTGCVTGEVSKVVPISGGKTITVPLTRDGLKPGEADGYRVLTATLLPGKEQRTAYYGFVLTSQQAPALRRIRIVDISDEKEASLLDVEKPKFEGHDWKAQTDVISADDPRLKWVFQITPSLRIYRFTLTKNDGSEVSFNHLSMYPPMIKSVMRAGWGEKY